MKKILLLLMSVILAPLGMMAADEVKTLTLTASDADGLSGTSYGTAANFDDTSNSGFKLTGYFNKPTTSTIGFKKSGGFIQLSENKNGYIISKVKISEAVTTGSAKPALTVYSNNTAYSYNTSATYTGTVAGTNQGSITCTTANTKYTDAIDVNNTYFIIHNGGTGAISISSIEIEYIVPGNAPVYNPNLEDKTLTFDGDKIQYTLWTKNTGDPIVNMWIEENNSNGDIDVVYNDDSDYWYVEALGAGSITVKATWGDDLFWAKGEATFTITVKEDNGLKDPELDVVYEDESINGKTITFTEGTSDLYEILVNPNNLDVTYSSTDPTIAEMKEGYLEVFGKVGSTEITVTFAGNDEYDAAELKFTVQVDAKVVEKKTYTDKLEIGSTSQSWEGTKGYASGTNDHSKDLKWTSSESGVKYVAVSYDDTKFQLNATTKSGIYVAENNKGYEIASITVNFNSSTTNDRKVTLYGNNSSYSTHGQSDGTQIGTATYTTNSTSVKFEDEVKGKGYTAFTINSNGAIYITSVEVVWEEGKPHAPEVKFEKNAYDFMMKNGSAACEVPAIQIEGVDVVYTLKNSEGVDVTEDCILDVYDGKVGFVAENADVYTLSAFAELSKLNDEFANATATTSINVTAPVAPEVKFEKESYTFYLRGEEVTCEIPAIAIGKATYTVTDTEGNDVTDDTLLGEEEGTVEVIFTETGKYTLTADVDLSDIDTTFENVEVSTDINVESAVALALTVKFNGKVIEDFTETINAFTGDKLTVESNYPNTEITITKGDDEEDYDSAKGYTLTKAGEYNLVIYGTDGVDEDTKTIAFNVTYAKGTKENPYTVAEFMDHNLADKSKVWVVGYMVGCVTSTGNLTSELANSNLALAASADIEDESSNIVPVQIPSGDIRTALNLKDNTNNIGKGIILYGSAETYFGKKGLKSISEYEFLPEPVKVAPTAVTFGEVAERVGAEEEVTVTLGTDECYPAAKIYYTTDGTMPTENSTLYTAPFTLSKENDGHFAHESITLNVLAVNSEGSVHDARTVVFADHQDEVEDLVIFVEENRFNEDSSATIIPMKYDKTAGMYTATLTNVAGVFYVRDCKAGQKSKVMSFDASKHTFDAPEVETTQQRITTEDVNVTRPVYANDEQSLISLPASLWKSEGGYTATFWTTPMQLENAETEPVYFTTDKIDKANSVDTCSVELRYNPGDEQALLTFNGTILTTVESVAAEDGEAIYFNLQGLRVERPGKGLYIRVSGNKSEKVAL